VVGVIKVAALLDPSASAQGRVDRMDAHAQPALFVPETLSGMELLERFRAEPSRLVMVVDEYGVVQGMLTPLDLLEAITGELKPQTQVDAWAVQRADGSWLLDGVMPVSELKARLDIRYLPAEEKGRYNTLAGLLLAVSGKLMRTGEHLNCAGWRFEVIDLDGRRSSQRRRGGLGRARHEARRPYRSRARLSRPPSAVAAGYGLLQNGRASPHALLYAGCRRLQHDIALIFCTTGALCR
jgi:CBS domain containing-hemolysin-like protein